MKPLVINARFLTQPASGVQRYARELLTAFDRRLASDPVLARRLGPVRAFYPAGSTLGAPPGWAAITLEPLRGGAGHLWEQGALARVSRGARLIGLCGSGPLLQKDQLVVFHDANVFDHPEMFSSAYRLFHRMMRPMLAQRVALTATVSQTAAKLLGPHLGLQADRFAVILNSAEHILQAEPEPSILARHGLVAGGYLLAVGNQSPNKNIARLVQAHAMAGSKMPVLVIAGGGAPGLKAATLTPSARFCPVGRVSDGELRSLYAGALGFVWPSRSEGFGIPPLEAMTLGTPVLSSQTTAMPEILGDAALYFDPENTADMAAKLGAFIRMTPQMRAAMAERGRKRARLFNWNESVDQLIAAVDRIGDQAEASNSENMPHRAVRERPVLNKVAHHR